MAAPQNILYSANVRTTEARVLRYKDFTFPYGPLKIDISEDSRLAEYNYLFTDGIELAKVRGRKTISIQGILVPDEFSAYRTGATNFEQKRATYINSPLSPGGEASGGNYSEAQRIFAKLSLLANGNAGVLVTPGLGVYNTAYLTKWSFNESGDYQRQLEYSLEFTVTKTVPPAVRIPESLQKKQEDLPDAEKTNVVYTIKSGDTLSAIAARFNMSLSEIKVLNPQLTDTYHKNGNLIFPGEQLRLVKGAALTETPRRPSGTGGGTGKKTTVKNTNSIPRPSRAPTYLNNKDTTGSKDPYYDIKPGTNINIVNPDEMSRSGRNTMDIYQKAKGTIVASVNTYFPAFGVDYNVKSTVDTKNPVYINDTKSIIT